MTNKKKILIETLHGSVAQLNELSSMTEGIDIYDDTGHVDTDFLIVVPLGAAGIVAGGHQFSHVFRVWFRQMEGQAEGDP